MSIGKFTAEQWRMVVALLVVAVVCTLLLSMTNLWTRAPIEQAERAALMRTLMQVLPKHSNDPLQDTQRLHVAGQTEPVVFYVARDMKGQPSAFAWEVIAPDGYSGSIYILMAVHVDGSIHAVRVTKHQETPGLGDGIVNHQSWLDFFAGKTLGNVHWGVKKDGGDFDQFTGATITPRAVVKAVKHGLEQFMMYREELLHDAKQPKSMVEAKNGK